MNKIKALLIGITAFVMPLTMTAGTAFATLGGQIEGGDIYRVRNVTKSSDFTDPVTADKCETVQFKVRIHNPGPNALEGVKVSATLPSAASTSHSSKVTVTADNADPKSTSDTAAVNLPQAYKISYVPGSTQLLDANNGIMQTLADGIVGGQVSIPGGVGVSTQQKRYVQFSAKVDCPTTPPVSTAECKVLDVKIYENRKVSVKVNTSVNNATIIGYKVDFGDGTVVNTQSATHTYAKDGTYKIVSSVQVKYHDGSTKWITSDGCAKEVTFETPEKKCEIKGKENLPADSPDCKETPVTPTPPSLPNTGAGSMVAIFTAVVGLSSIAYSVVTRKFGLGQ